MATPKAQRTWTPRAGQVTRGWRVVDAEGQTLGRLASQVAGYLRGKHLPTFAEHMDLGDFVVVVNASRIRVTGNKLRQKMYYRHSGYPGGFKAVALGDVLPKHPDRVIRHAVKGMLPHNALGRKILGKLKVYAGPTHPHRGQLSESAAAPPPPRPSAQARADRRKAAQSGTGPRVAAVVATTAVAAEAMATQPEPPDAEVSETVAPETVAPETAEPATATAEPEANAPAAATPAAEAPDADADTTPKPTAAPTADSPEQ